MSESVSERMVSGAVVPISWLLLTTLVFSGNVADPHTILDAGGVLEPV